MSGYYSRPAIYRYPRANLQPATAFYVYCLFHFLFRLHIYNIPKKSEIVRVVVKTFIRAFKSNMFDLVGPYNSYKIKYRGSLNV